MEEKKLRKVEAASWLSESNENPEGLKKAVELEGYPGVFKDFNGKVIDLRSPENYICKTNLEPKSNKELSELLRKGYEEQLKQLNLVGIEDKHYKEVNNDLKQRLQKLNQIYPLPKTA